MVGERGVGWDAEEGGCDEGGVCGEGFAPGLVPCFAVEEGLAGG